MTLVGLVDPSGPTVLLPPGRTECIDDRFFDRMYDAMKALQHTKQN